MVVEEQHLGVEEEQQIAVLGEVVVVAESLVSGGVAVELPWSCGGVAVELRWRAATPGLAAAASGGGEGASGMGNGSARPALMRTVDDALYRSSGNGAGSRLVAEVAQGRGWWRKWRRAVAFQLFAPTHMGCFLLSSLLAFR